MSSPWALETGVRLEALKVQRPTLEDVYLSLVGEGEPEPDKAATPGDGSET